MDSEEFTAPAKTWSLYPNPASNTLTITTTADLTENFTTIYDITGRQVLNEKFNETINVSALPAGVYILKIGEMSRKFVKN
ncbi:T9SS type A sorting domain-containing protein [Flavobacterium sp. J372]|uniref:T9SS type A sorting domain-containing protein n=1 Tax=Flavobacterium sp. J372 TaxID=2898436 RepID=UPI002151D429|nr:T9SS type A sorting domain-containing protein [Flavobacterium sp. J372]MCR5862367.1 T9SS type A sorting domain-containing protein [Flavobacterium sp. J372]